MPKFEEERRGYSKEQVDEYISTIQNEYQNLQDELAQEQEKGFRFEDRLQGYKEQLAAAKEQLASAQANQAQVTAENDKLKKEVEHLKIAGNPAYSDAIASALVSAEMSARQIIANAKKEAELTSQSAMRELSDIIQAKKAALNEIMTLSGKLNKILAEEAEFKEAGEVSAEQIISTKEMEG